MDRRDKAIPGQGPRRVQRYGDPYRKSRHLEGFPLLGNIPLSASTPLYRATKEADIPTLAELETMVPRLQISALPTVTTGKPPIR